MGKFAVLHNYGAYEDWKFTKHGELDDLAAAIDAREEELASMGGVVGPFAIHSVS